MEKQIGCDMKCWDVCKASNSTEEMQRRDTTYELDE